MSDTLEGRPAMLADESWGAWVTGDPETIREGASVLIVTEGGRQWTAPVVEVIRHDPATGETLCRVGAGSASEDADREAWRRRMRRAHDAPTLRARARAARRVWGMTPAARGWLFAALAGVTLWAVFCACTGTPAPILRDSPGAGGVVPALRQHRG